MVVALLFLLNVPLLRMSHANSPRLNARKHVHWTECDVLMVLARTTLSSALHFPRALLPNQFFVGMTLASNSLPNALTRKLVQARECRALVVLVQRTSANVLL
jgi:hypothetical protein